MSVTEKHLHKIISHCVRSRKSGQIVISFKDGKVTHLSSKDDYSPIGIQIMAENLGKVKVVKQVKVQPRDNSIESDVNTGETGLNSNEEESGSKRIDTVKPGG